MHEQIRRHETAERVCATCGRPLTQLGENGECLRCLVSVGFGVDEEPASARPASRQRTTPGPLRYAHFEIETGADGFPVELGWGAMAVTYRARDTVLNSAVALKVIDSTIAANPAARARFLREARAAAQLHHPNVARVTHYGEQEGECFYVMELVEGETLEARVRRDGPMPLALALEVMEQAARALAAAEAHGVVHRDIKPSNLMIESEASGSILVKVIDYGIAKMTSLQAESGIDHTQSRFVGTPAFASPEQFAGSGQTPIDTRSDIYSLGVTLWYLLSGRTPFVGRTLEEVRARQTNDLPIEQLRNADVPAPILTLLRSMLAIDPADRPQSARELLTAVHRCYVRFEPHARSRRKRRLVASGIAAFLLAATLGGNWFYQHARSIAQTERSIAVLPFENLSPASEDAFFTVGMQNEIAAELSLLANLKTIGPQSTRSYLPGTHRDLSAIGRELSVRHLLEGSVWRANGEMRVLLRLVDLRDPDRPWTGSYQRPVKEVFALQGEITRMIAQHLQTPLSASERAVLNRPPTSDLRAYDFYLRALATNRLVRDTAEQRSNTQQRLSLLKEAVARDPKFALAYCEMAKAHDTLHRTRRGASEEERATDHRALAAAALENARRVDPDSGQVHLALATHFFAANNDLDQARLEVDLARRTLPNNAELEAIAGTIARSQGRWDDAVRFFERVVALEPRDNMGRFTLANTHRLLRRYEEFDRLIVEVIAVMPATDSAAYRLFRAFGPLEGHADMAPLRIALSGVRPEEDPDNRSRNLHEMILALADHDAPAVLRILATASEAAFVFNGVKYPKSWYEGLAARIRGDNPAAQNAFRAARLEVNKTVEAEPADGRALGLLAMIDAGLDRKEEAVREAQRACELALTAIDAPVVRSNLAVVYAWTGEAEMAIAELNKIIDKPAGGTLPAQPTYGDLRLNPVWDPLRHDPSFMALVAKLAPSAPR